MRLGIGSIDMQIFMILRLAVFRMFIIVSLDLFKQHNKFIIVIMLSNNKWRFTFCFYKTTTYNEVNCMYAHVHLMKIIYNWDTKVR